MNLLDVAIASCVAYSQVIGRGDREGKGRKRKEKKNMVLHNSNKKNKDILTFYDQ